MEPVLKGVSACVDVWSSNRRENYSKLFEQQLLDMGAKVSKALNKHVTHVVFKDGHLAKWRKAQEMGVKIVSVLWVEKCRQTGLHVDESLFPALAVDEEFPLLMKKHRCMQPKTFVEKTPENSRRMQRRLDQMAKELAEQKRAVSAETDVPVLLFQDDGSLVYSPIGKIKDLCTEMKRRVKKMKKKRENLSPTASQRIQIPPSSSPGDGSLPPCVLTDSEDSLLPGKQMEDCLNSSYDCIGGTNKKQKTETVKDTSASTEICVSMSASVSPPSCSRVQESLTSKQHSRKSLKKWILQHTVDDKLSLEKEDLKKLPNKKRKNENSMSTSAGNDGPLPHLKGLGQITPYEKPDTLNTVPALTDNLSDSFINSKDLNTCSLYRSCPVDRNNSIEDRMRKKVQALSHWKLTTSEPGASGSEEFLKAITTCNKSFCTEETSYEDFFSSSNLNEKSVQVQIPKESQNFPEVCCEVSCTSMDSLDGSSKKSHSASKKSRKNSIPRNDVSVKKKTNLTEHLGSMPLNYVSDGKKTDTAEALDSDVNRLPQQNCEKSFRTNVNCCIDTTGDGNKVSECHVTDGSCTVYNEPANKPNGRFRKTRRLQKVLQSLESGHWISEEPYELSSSFPAAPICRLHRPLSTGKDQQNLFSNQPVMFVSPTSDPPCKKLIELIELSGGKICKALRQAKICIGKEPQKKYQEIKCLSEKWVLDSITQHTICPMENYIFKL
ncbi:microcephalin isoform X1 [Pogoniulus pusillus]|uniref:microcephalin isoform X1 n=1 Tax=Pogoniulus pusillus TaxID=488313 RepID=UPI0030B94597